MVRLKNIEKNDTAVWCDIYPENSKEPGFLKVLFSRPDKIETFSLPRGYEDDISHVNHARDALSKMIEKNEFKKERLVMWY